MSSRVEYIDAKNNPDRIVASDLLESEIELVDLTESE